MATVHARRPSFARRSILQLVNNVAQEIANEHGGKIPDVFLIDAKLKQRFLADPELLDIDRHVSQCRKYFFAQTNARLNASMRMTGSLFVPGFLVPLGKRQTARMRDMDPITDTAAWLQITRAAQDQFNQTMDARVEKQLRLIEEGNTNRDCNTWGELESKLRGYRPSPEDLNPFASESRDAPEPDDDPVSEAMST